MFFGCKAAARRDRTLVMLGLCEEPDEVDAMMLGIVIAPLR